MLGLAAAAGWAQSSKARSWTPSPALLYSSCGLVPVSAKVCGRSDRGCLAIESPILSLQAQALGAAATGFCVILNFIAVGLALEFSSLCLSQAASISLQTVLLRVGEGWHRHLFPFWFLHCNASSYSPKGTMVSRLASVALVMVTWCVDNCETFCLHGKVVPRSSYSATILLCTTYKCLLNWVMGTGWKNYRIKPEKKNLDPHNFSIKGNTAEE